MTRARDIAFAAFMLVMLFVSCGLVVTAEPWAMPHTAAPALTLRATPAAPSMAVPVSIRIAGER